MKWSKWIQVNTPGSFDPYNANVLVHNRTLVEVETPKGRFLLAELNHKGGACDCCQEVNWTPECIIRYRTLNIPQS